MAESSLSVKDSFFVGNKVSFLGAGDGGALFVFRTETVVIFNTTFRNCSGSSGGAISAVLCGNITIKKKSIRRKQCRLRRRTRVWRRGH